MLTLGFSSPPPSFGRKLPAATSLKIPARNFILAKSNKLVSPISSSSSSSSSDHRLELKTLPEGLKPELMPKHVAIFSDGHRRWAKEKGLSVETGYGAGRKPIQDIVKLCCEFGIEVLSIYAFSSGDWLRPKDEVVYAMKMIESIVKSDVEELNRLSVIGNRAGLPKHLQDQITQAEQLTKDNKMLHIIGAVDYNGRSDIVQSCKAISKKVENGQIQHEDINEDLFQHQLQTSCCLEYPDPDLYIRTSGISRLGNFMLWQMAYSELVFVEKYGPDFGKADFIQALIEFQNRSRRFGGHKYSRERLPEE